MTTVILPFRKWPIQIDEAKRISYYVVKPLLIVTLNPEGKEHLGPLVPFYAEIDTGADLTVFPGHVAESLGFNITEGRPKRISGIGGSILCYAHRIDLTIEYPEKPDFFRPSFSGPAYFSNELNELPWGPLGEDILSQMKMKLSIDYKNLFIELTY